MTQEQPKETRAEKDAASGTVEAMWIGYRDNVLHALHVQARIPLTEHAVKTSRLDFLAGIKAATTLMRVAKERRGVDLDAMLGLVEADVLEQLSRKA